MTMIKMLRVAMVLALGIMGPSTRMSAQPKTSLQIFIPRKVAPGGMPAPFPQIGVVKANVNVNSSSPVTFTISDPNGVTQSFSALTPTGTTQTMSFPLAPGNTAPGGDTVIVKPNPDTAHPNQYEIDFVLRSDSKLDCTGTQLQPQNVYTIAVGAAAPKMTGACLDSYDGRYRSVPINSCTNAALVANLIPIPLDDPADKVASLDQVTQPTQRCFSFVPAPPAPPTNLRVVPHFTRFPPYRPQMQ